MVWCKFKIHVSNHGCCFELVLCGCDCFVFVECLSGLFNSKNTVESLDSIFISCSISSVPQQFAFKIEC